MRLFGAVLLVFCSVVFPAAASCDYPALFNFGDSNSDTGGFSAALIVDFIGETAVELSALFC
ncbi:unnamed protein product [Spirodela intermedia]|uniref:GDSL esterase/lipase n=1 Tax=Spirodela intermedia TaxID=51605 RepID=A0ABN7ECX9_SPIIN|nr:unnamed protein product [Spirodela intermedia]